MHNSSSIFCLIMLKSVSKLNGIIVCCKHVDKVGFAVFFIISYLCIFVFIFFIYRILYNRIYVQFSIFTLSIFSSRINCWINEETAKKHALLFSKAMGDNEYSQLLDASRKGEVTSFSLGMFFTSNESQRDEVATWKAHQRALYDMMIMFLLDTSDTRTPTTPD